MISGYEHNAVTRPLAALGAQVSVAAAPAVSACSGDWRPLTGLIVPGTDAVICTHVSNVFGFVQPVEAIARYLPGAGGTLHHRRVPVRRDADRWT